MPGTKLKLVITFGPGDKSEFWAVFPSSKPPLATLVNDLKRIPYVDGVKRRSKDQLDIRVDTHLVAHQRRVTNEVLECIQKAGASTQSR